MPDPPPVTMTTLSLRTRSIERPFRSATLKPSDEFVIAQEILATRRGFRDGLFFLFGLMWRNLFLQSRINSLSDSLGKFLQIIGITSFLRSIFDKMGQKTIISCFFSLLAGNSPATTSRCESVLWRGPNDRRATAMQRWVLPVPCRLEGRQLPPSRGLGGFTAVACSLTQVSAASTTPAPTSDATIRSRGTLFPVRKRP